MLRGGEGERTQEKLMRAAQWLSRSLVVSGTAREYYDGTASHIRSKSEAQRRRCDGTAKSPNQREEHFRSLVA